MDRKRIAAGLLDALERADSELRQTMRAEFRRVDQIKAQPGWRPFASERNRWKLHSFIVSECAWCGENFFTLPRAKNSPPKRYCDHSCDHAMRAFKRRRARQ